MDFEFSPKVKDLQKRLTAFMEAHVYPNEAKYQQHSEGPDRWQPVPIIEELKPKARAAAPLDPPKLAEHPRSELGRDTLPLVAD